MTVDREPTKQEEEKSVEERIEEPTEEEAAKEKEVPKERGRKPFERGGRRRKPFEEEKVWIPKTELGERVLKGEFKSLEEILKQGFVILEPEIIDHLVPDIKEDIVYIGGTPGKGGGIRRTATKKTSRMHKSGRRFKLTALVVVGNESGIIGLGKSSSKEHRIAIEKASEQAKLNIIRVKMGCGSWECACGGTHSIPFKTEAKEGSVKVVMLPAPKGTGIVASRAIKQIVQLAGIKDVWIKTYGKTATRANLSYAVFKAMQNLMTTKGEL